MRETSPSVREQDAYLMRLGTQCEVVLETGEQQVDEAGNPILIKEWKPDKYPHAIFLYGIDFALSRPAAAELSTDTMYTLRMSSNSAHSHEEGVMRFTPFMPSQIEAEGEIVRTWMLHSTVGPQQTYRSQLSEFLNSYRREYDGR